MVRTSKAIPSNVDAGALDDLDLDDMFADDGDMLFEGLDIQLEGMGDLIATEKSETIKQSKKQEDDPEDDTPKRRKTKRKTKVPVAFGDDDEDYLDEIQPKKKSRKSKQAAAPPVVNKKKKTKKDSGIVPHAPTTSSSLLSNSPPLLPPPTTIKSKKSLIPPPTGGAVSRGSSGVAAAGRFGKRTTGTGSGSGSATTKVKRKKSEVYTPAPPPTPTTPPEPSLFLPKQEPTFGGLHPSKTHFYPFLECVPPEPSMKNRKQFSHLDKIATAMHNFLTTGSNGETTLPDLSLAKEAQLEMDSPIVQLLLETFEAISEKDKLAFGETKKQALLACLPELRSIADGLEPQKLLADLYAMCGLLTRQYNFLKTSLTNMELWCKATFSDADYRQAFSLPEPFKPEKVGTVITAANRKWKKAIIPVKLVFAGYKEVKGTPVLLARLPPAVLHPDKKKKEDSTKKKKKPTEKSVAPMTLPNIPVTVFPKAPAAPKAYADCPPPERRQRILEKVAQLALALESQLNFRRTKRSLTPSTAPSSNTATATATATTKTATEKMIAATVTATYIPQEDPPLHTARLWEWLEVAGFFNSASSADSQSSKYPGLRLQSPEIYPRGLLLPTATRIQGRKQSDDNDGIIASNGLFDRLQSLLVVEDDGQEKSDKKKANRWGDDDSDSESDDEDKDSLSFLDEDSDDEYQDVENPSQNLADLSNLSMEERTFLHLCSAGLIKESLFPMVELVLEEQTAEDAMEDDLVNVIGEMSAELSTLTTRNNARIGFLESAMDPLEVAYQKQLEEEQASIIARCQSLLKRSKEKAKKSNKQRSTGGGIKDDLNLPW